MDAEPDKRFNWLKYDERYGKKVMGLFELAESENINDGEKAMGLFELAESENINDGEKGMGLVELEESENINDGEKMIGLAEPAESENINDEKKMMGLVELEDSENINDGEKVMGLVEPAESENINDGEKIMGLVELEESENINETHSIVNSPALIVNIAEIVTNSLDSSQDMSIAVNSVIQAISQPLSTRSSPKPLKVIPKPKSIPFYHISVPHWSSEEDDYLWLMATSYSFNWNLIAQSLNSMRIGTYMSRGAWDCHNRYLQLLATYEPKNTDEKTNILYGSIRKTTQFKHDCKEKSLRYISLFEKIGKFKKSIFYEKRNYILF
jgi:hypothetical protein